MKEVKQLLKMQFYYFLLLILQIYSHNLRSVSAETIPCRLRSTKFGAVCLCSIDYCDYLENPKPSADNDFAIVSSSRDGLRFEVSKGQFNNSSEEAFFNNTNNHQPKFVNSTVENFGTVEALLVENGRTFIQFTSGASSGKLTPLKNSRKLIHLHVNREKQYQKIVGFGGAFTGAVSDILSKLHQHLQNHIYRSYYHKDGIGYNLIRIPIGGCDFDLEPWAYNENPRHDAKLSNFTRLDTRDSVKVYQISRLKDEANLKVLKVMAAAWSPPTWMKSNERWTGFSYLKPEYYQAWADYHLRFLELMHDAGLPIWAISTGNEPLNGVIGWYFVRFMSLGWTARNQAIWLSKNLGPTIKNSSFKNVLIFGNDDQRYTYPAWFRTMNASSANSLDYLDGLAVHWYWDDVFGPNLIDITHKAMPHKLLLSTEASIGDKPWQTHGPELGSWQRAEQYIRSLMQDLQHAFNGWIDWNLVLDEEGGPNYVRNFVDSAIIVNTTNTFEFYKQPLYYAIGHFSKFLPEDSVRIHLQFSDFNIDAVGFQRPDGTLAVILFNGANTSLDVALSDSLRGDFVINLPAHSLHTIIYN